MWPEAILNNETKGGICVKIEFNPQKNISLLQDGRHFFIYSSNMAAVMSCEHTLYEVLILLISKFLAQDNDFPAFWLVS